MQLRRVPVPRAAVRSLTLLSALVVTAAVAVAALWVTPPSAADTTIGRVTVSVRPGPGGTQLDLPPLGHIRAGTHRAPLRFEVSLRELAPERIGEAVGGDGGAGALADARTAIGWAAVRQVLTAMGMAAAIGLLLCLARARRTRPQVLRAALGPAALVALLGAASALGYAPEAFKTATFHGPLQQAPEIMRRFDTALQRIDELRNRLDVVTEQIGTLTSGAPERRNTATILHVSDLHSNPVGVLWINELFARFDVDAVIDTGDITSFGYDQERSLIEEPLTVAAERYYIVYGNHDATAIRERLNRRLTPLHGRTLTVAGLRVLGIDDPTYTVTEGSNSPGDQRRYDDAGDRLAAWCERDRPLIVAVHHPDLAERVDGCAAIVLTGHWHRSEHYRLAGGTLVSLVDSTGADGFEGLRPDGLYHAELLRFADGVLYAVDVLTMNPTTGEFTIRRVDPGMVDTTRP